MTRLIMVGCSGGPSGFNNIEKGLRVETCAADEGSIDIGLGHEVGGILRFDTAAVEDADGGPGGTKERDKELSNLLMDIVGLFGGGYFASTDGPDRLVGDDQLLELVGRESGEGRADLGFDD